MASASPFLGSSRLTACQCSIPIGTPASGHLLRHLIFSPSSRKTTNGPFVVAKIQIDRKGSLDEALKRQKEAEIREAEADLTCPIDCIRSVENLSEFDKLLKQSEERNQLVVVDFYNAACGACKYMLPQFMKLCKQGCMDVCNAEEGSHDVVYVKHNVLDEYDELTDLSRFYKIRSVPMFAFFMNGALVERFPTRDRHKLEQAICRLLD